ncbi:hypothetical protein D9613_009704 [Agrocybe pediades]|uniref:Uncharacterized protein n=1 Tax=Agrocybe pediades TaxID=84607 RepID=A0A8H4QYB1_9AGAR|nr:hypothetical protein D9613_009704 [Agrocybe pediades]
MHSSLLPVLLTPREPAPGSSGGNKSSSSSGGGSKSSGGGGGGGAKSGGGSSRSAGGKSSSSSSNGGSGRAPGKSGGGSAFGAGVKQAPAQRAIPPGQPFAGRSEGGGTRDGIYGSRTYGSGYPSGYAPGFDGRGTYGMGFPYGYWPICWPVTYSGDQNNGNAKYLNGTEYADNSERPGGPLAMANFTSLMTPKSKFYIVADNDTISDLLSAIIVQCNASLDLTAAPSAGAPFNNTPRPEQVIQYYRASTIALSLEGYNNTATYGPEGTPDSSLPSNVDTLLMGCLNKTIGDTAAVYYSWDDGFGGKHKLAPGEIASIVVGSIFGGGVVLYYCLKVYIGTSRRR